MNICTKKLVLPDVVDDFDHPVPRFGEEDSDPEPEPWEEPEVTSAGRLPLDAVI